MDFESLGGSGHGCEFGVFQREFGAEPLGLLRWADLAPHLLAEALEREFEGVGLAENTVLFVPSGDRPEYWTRDSRYWMAMRTFVAADAVPEEQMREQVSRRLQFLRDKLMGDLQTGEKIFVFKVIERNLTDEEIGRLHATMRRYGDNTLLYVRYEDEEHPNGTVEVAADGLMIGYIDRFAFSKTDENLGPATESWTAVCKAAHSLWTARAKVGTVRNLARSNTRAKHDMVVLIRAHVVDEKFKDLWDALDQSDRKYDLFPLIDETNGRPTSSCGEPIWHSVSRCREMGLNQTHSHLLWLCGDFALFFALLGLPPYRYYTMVEYDVHFPFDACSFMNELSAVLAARADAGNEIDGVVLDFKNLAETYRAEPNAPRWPFFDAANAAFSEVYHCYFPLVTVSRTALSHLYSVRQGESERNPEPDQVMHCEAVFPSALIEAGFRCVDLISLLPASYTHDEMKHPRRLKDAKRSVLSTKMIHPVYTDEGYLARLLANFTHEGRLTEFLAVLEGDLAEEIPAALVNRYKALALERMTEKV
jgi:hypothetical protein